MPHGDGDSDTELFAPSLVEMIAELERDLLARKRVYANRTYTRRLSALTAERRLEVLGAVVGNLRAQAAPGELAELDARRAKRREYQLRRRAAKRARLDQLLPPASITNPQP